MGSTGMFLSNIGKSDDSVRKDKIDDRDIKEKGLKFRTEQWDLPKERKSKDYSNGKSDDSVRKDEIDDRDIKEKGLKFRTEQWDLPKDRKSQDYSNGKGK